MLLGARDDPGGAYSGGMYPRCCQHGEKTKFFKARSQDSEPKAFRAQKVGFPGKENALYCHSGAERKEEKMDAYQGAFLLDRPGKNYSAIGKAPVRKKEEGRS